MITGFIFCSGFAEQTSAPTIKLDGKGGPSIQYRIFWLFLRKKNKNKRHLNLIENYPIDKYMNWIYCNCSGFDRVCYSLRPLHKQQYIGKSQTKGSLTYVAVFHQPVWSQSHPMDNFSCSAELITLYSTLFVTESLPL